MKFFRQLFRRSGIGDAAFGLCVANGGDDVGAFAAVDVLNGLPDDFLLRTKLAADGGEGAANDVAVLFLFSGLDVDDVIEIFFQALQGTAFGGENCVVGGTQVLPIVFQRRGGQFGLRFEKVVKAAFFELTGIAQVINANRAIAGAGNQVARRFQQPEFRFAFLHGAI